MGRGRVSQGAGRGGASGNQPSRVSPRPGAPNWQAFQSGGACGGADEGTSRSERGELLAWGEESRAEGTPGQSGGKCAPRKELAGKPVQQQVCWTLGDTLRMLVPVLLVLSFCLRGRAGTARARRRYIQERVVCQLSLCWDRWG